VNIDGTYFKKSSDGADTIEMTMHRDKCDDIELFIEEKTYRRIPQVMDCWFDSGSVPFAEYHYPFENVEVFANKPSADFIVEYVGQVRAWFSALFRMSVGLFDSHAFDNVICTGTVAGNDGRKMSKSFGNFVDPKPVFENIGGDAIRLSLVNNGLLLGVDAIVSEETMREQVKVILLPYLNSVKYFELYASDFKYDSNFVPTNATDKWIVAKLNILLSKVESSLQAYDIPNAVCTFQPFLADLSSWYIKVNRDRFVKHDNDALNTLFMVLYRFNLVVAPFIPFISEKFWFVLSKYLEEDMLNDHMESVHMQDFPVVIDNLEETVDILSKVEKVQEIISLGLNFRIANAMPVKQVLASANILTVDSLDEWQLDLVKQELNVLSTNTTIASDPKDESVQLDLNLTDDLKAMGVIREFTSKVQQERKRAGKMVGEIVNIQVTVSNFDRDALSKDWNQLKEKLLIDNVEWASGDKLKVEVV
jgi:isoleucyl-tRNA synthetase